MVAQGDGGAIVNVASNAGKVGYRNMAGYNASKAAVISLTRSLSLEWAEHRIGLDHVFTVSLNARQIGAAKPHPRCFERLAQELALDPGAIAYVGDDPQLDVAAARAAGLRTVWMNRRAHAWPQELPPADLTVRDCAQLAAALRA